MSCKYVAEGEPSTSHTQHILNPHAWHICRSHVNKVLSNTGQIKNDLIRCLIAEFMGTLLFQIFGGAAPPKDTTAPAANGFALVCIGKCPLVDAMGRTLARRSRLSAGITMTRTIARDDAAAIAPFPLVT